MKYTFPFEAEKQPFGRPEDVLSPLHVPHPAAAAAWHSAELIRPEPAGQTFVPLTPETKAPVAWADELGK